MQSGDIEVNITERLFFACHPDGVLRAPVSRRYYTINSGLTSIRLPPPTLHLISIINHISFVKLRQRLPLARFFSRLLFSVSYFSKCLLITKVFEGFLAQLETFPPFILFVGGVCNPECYNNAPANCRNDEVCFR